MPADIGELWAPSEPNGLGWEGCMETGLSEGGLVHDADCEALHCTICNFTTFPRMTLRGICPNLDIDTNYVLRLNHYHNGFLRFIGSSIFEIRFSKKGQA